MDAGLDRRTAAIILAGGAGTRLGGVFKPGLDIGGVRLLDVAVDAARLTNPLAIVVVGPCEVPPGVRVTREEPAGGGPAAAIAAGLTAVADVPVMWVLVLASDMPRGAAAVPALLAAASAGGTDGAWLIDEGGREQPLAAVYRVESLSAAAMARAQSGSSMRELTRGLVMTPVIDEWHASADIDTWEDLARARAAG